MTEDTENWQPIAITLVDALNLHIEILWKFIITLQYAVDTSDYELFQTAMTALGGYINVRPKHESD